MKNYSTQIKAFENACGHKFNSCETDFAIFWIENGFTGVPNFNSKLADNFRSLMNY